MDIKLSLSLLQTFDWRDSQNKIYEVDISSDESIVLNINGEKSGFVEKIYGVVDNCLWLMNNALKINRIVKDKELEIFIDGKWIVLSKNKARENL